MEEAGACNVSDRGSHLLTCMNDIHSESIYCISPYVIPVHAGDEDLPLVVVYKQPSDHFVIFFASFPNPVGFAFRRSQEKFLQERIKVNGKTGNFGNNVALERNKNKINLTSDIPFSKRYLKYMTKKYLKKNNLRDWLRVVANNKESYELRYFQINNEDEEEDEDE